VFENAHGEIVLSFDDNNVAVRPSSCDVDRHDAVLDQALGGNHDRQLNTAA